MGKIRVKVLGDESTEKQQKEEARKRAEFKRAVKHEADEKPATAETQKKSEAQKFSASESFSDSVVARKASETSKPKAKSSYAAKNAKVKHSDKYQKTLAKVDKSKVYSLTEALQLLPQLTLSKFDETVELHINTVDKGISGNVTLPHGTGKQTRIKIADQTNDPKAVEALVKEVEAGTINFDVLIATPDAMPKLAKIARFLGPRGLMPNPKNGTVSPKPEEVAKRFAGGHVNFKTEAKFPILHMSVGKVSFGDKKLAENITAALEAIQAKNIRNITLKSTMSPGLRISVNTEM